MDDSEEDLATSLNILIENIQNLIKELSIGTINRNVVNYYKEVKSRILSMISEGKVYQTSNAIQSTEYAPQAYFEIKVFKHAAIPLNLINKTNNLIEEGSLNEKDKIESIDLRIYKIGEEKHHNIEHLLAIMRRNSVGSIIYSNINKDLVDIPEITNVDYSNYDILHSEELVSNIQKQIIEICRNNNIFTLLELADLLTKYQVNFLLNAFDKLGYNIPFMDRTGKFLNPLILQRIKELFHTNESKFLISIINKMIKNRIVISQSLISERTMIPLIEKYRQKFIIIALEN